MADDKISITKQPFSTQDKQANIQKNLNKKVQQDDDGDEGGGGSGKKRLRGFGGENLLNALAKGVLKNTGHVKSFAERHIGTESLEKLPLSKDTDTVNQSKDEAKTEKEAQQRVKDYTSDIKRSGAENSARRSADANAGRGNFFGNNATFANVANRAATAGAHSVMHNIATADSRIASSRFGGEGGTISASSAKTNELGVAVQQRHGNLGNFLENSSKQAKVAASAVQNVTTSVSHGMGKRGR